MQEMAAESGRAGPGCDPVRPRALGADQRRGRARRSHRHVSGRSGVCLAQPCAGRAADGLRMVQACERRRLAVFDQRTIAARGEGAGAVVLRHTGAELDRVEFLRPQEKRETMIVNLRNIFSRMEPTRQDMQTLHGAIKAIAEGARGPARGGVLDGDEAARLRALAGDHRRRPHAGRAGAGARACAAVAAKHDRRRARAVEGVDKGQALRRPVQAPDAGRAADSGFRVVRLSRWRSS